MEIYKCSKWNRKFVYRIFLSGSKSYIFRSRLRALMMAGQLRTFMSIKIPKLRIQPLVDKIKLYLLQFFRKLSRMINFHLFFFHLQLLSAIWRESDASKETTIQKQNWLKQNGEQEQGQDQTPCMFNLCDQFNQQRMKMKNKIRWQE